MLLAECFSGLPFNPLFVLDLLLYVFNCVTWFYFKCNCFTSQCFYENLHFLFVLFTILKILSRFENEKFDKQFKENTKNKVIVMSYYAVSKGREPGIYRSWTDCRLQIEGFSGAKYKKFSTLEEANRFIGVEVCGKPRVRQTYFRTEPPRSKADIVIFTDGCCINNGKRRNVSAGYGVFFGEGDPRNIAEPYKDRPTNNRAELYAIIRAIEVVELDIKQGKTVEIYTDSDYSLKTYTSYAPKWKKRGWKKSDGKPVKNLELVKRGYELYSTYSSRVKLTKVKAHTGATDFLSVGNDWADRLANIGAGL